MTEIKHKPCPLIGLAIGDALGTSLEFTQRDSQDAISGMVGGGPFDLIAGEWTDDTSMALALAHAVLSGDWSLENQLKEYCRWYCHGEYSHRQSCFDIGITTQEALSRFMRENETVAHWTEDSAGNGSIMRLAPVVLAYRKHLKFEQYLEDSSKTTHSHPLCVEGCKFLGYLLKSCIEAPREPFRSHVKSCLGHISQDTALSAAIECALDQALDARESIPSTGYVVDTIHAACWSVLNTQSPHDALLLAVNLSGDSDTIGAVTGQIAGAYYGVDAFPQEWLDVLSWRDAIRDYEHALSVMGDS